jgi:xanthosine utilization system XapX-like protein
MSGKTFAGHFIEILKVNRLFALLQAGIIVTIMVLGLVYNLPLAPAIALVGIGMIGRLCMVGSQAAARMEEQLKESFAIRHAED